MMGQTGSFFSQKELETGDFLSALGSTRQRHSAALGGIGGVHEGNDKIIN